MKPHAIPVAGLDLAVTHLNAPYGPIVSRDDLSRALRNGDLTAASENVGAILTYLFVELDPALIIRCVNEFGSRLAHANELYEQTLRAKAPVSLAWERAVRHLL